jgi:hypothetical protein
VGTGLIPATDISAAAAADALVELVPIAMPAMPVVLDCFVAPPVLRVEVVLVLFALAQPATRNATAAIGAARRAALLRFVFEACVLSPLRGLERGSATEGPLIRALGRVSTNHCGAPAAAYPGTTIFSLLELGIALPVDSGVAIWSPEPWNGISVYSV